MVRPLLLRGLAAGLCAGLVAGAVAFAVAEPRIDEAIALEHPAHGAPVSRKAQKAGLGVALAATGVAVGCLYALVFAVALGRVGPRGPRALAWTLAGTLFAALVAVPALKYPASPPGVGDPSTIEPRTAWYLTLLACSLLGLLASVRAWRSARRRFGRGAGAVAGVATYCGCVAAAVLLLPGVDEVPRDFPSDLLWEFRAASLATQLAFWSALAASFAALVPRVLR